LGWLDEHWDHTFILWDEDTTALAAVKQADPTKYFLLPWNPTAENMARYLLEVVAPHVLDDLGVLARRVAVWETEESCAIATLAGTGGEPRLELGSAITVDSRS
jgi:6-pyruvoyltetrahydropterin/6-carboxytetrahydropterin synthase